MPGVRDPLELMLTAILEAESEPATRSLTVLETSTSPGPASEEMRAPIETAMPTILPSLTSHSPVWRPARTSRPIAAQRLAEGGGGLDGPRGPIECREEPVPGRVELAAMESGELATDDRVMALEQLTPGGVSEPRRELRRAHDVGEQDRREHALGGGSP